MKKASEILCLRRFREQHGVTLALVAILLIVLVGFTALAVDVSHLMVVKNELQNAADAGALAGARVLYVDGGTAVNPDANQEGYDGATANQAISEDGTIDVDVNWTSGTNTGDVQRGHWSFAQKQFTPSDSLDPVNLAIYSTDDLDRMCGDPDPAKDCYQDPGTGDYPVFINAVQVIARREATPAASFFAKLFGYDNFALDAVAVAYLGFAGTLMPEDVEQPIAICKQAITDDDGNVSCNTGRMFNSGGGTTNNTAGWTNFSQPCVTASVPTVNPLICGSGNPEILNFGTGMGTVGGVQASVYNNLLDCWLNAPVAKDWRGYPTERWTQTLPVIDCPANNVSPCSDLVGAVTVDFVWVKQSGADPNWLDVPMQMEDWECESFGNALADGLSPADAFDSLDETARQGCWADFADHFGLVTYDDTPVGELTHSDVQRTMYFLPTCEPQEPRGVSGGENFGILAEVPVLVK